MNSYMTSDEELIKKVKTGDDMAFQELMSRYTKHIFNFILQYVKSREEAEDVSQDTFFKTWKYMKRFKDGMKFKPWLFTIARNTALDYIKKKKAITFSSMESDEDDNFNFADTLSDNDPLPPELFARKELANELSEAMTDLHPDHKSVLMMHYHEDMTFEEISEIMKKPMNTVKSWHHRSLSKVKTKLLHRKSS